MFSVFTTTIQKDLKWDAGWGDVVSCFYPALSVMTSKEAAKCLTFDICHKSSFTYFSCFRSCFADAQPWSKMRWNPTLRFQRDSAHGKISRYDSDFIALCRNVNLAPWEICRTVKKAVLVLSDLIILADTRAVKRENWKKKPSHLRKLSFR